MNTYTKIEFSARRHVPSLQWVWCVIPLHSGCSSVHAGWNAAAEPHTRIVLLNHGWHRLSLVPDLHRAHGSLSLHCQPFLQVSLTCLCHGCDKPDTDRIGWATPTDALRTVKVCFLAATSMTLTREAYVTCSQRSYWPAKESFKIIYVFYISYIYNHIFNVKP